MKNEYEEKDLLDRARHGDQGAFEQLVRGTERLVYNLALRMVKNEQDALDMSQEAYLRAWRSLSSFEGKCSFSSWMYTLTRNVCLDHSRTKRISSVSLDATNEAGDEFELPVSDDSTPERIAEKNEEAREIRRAIESMSKLQREIIILSDVEGYGYREIAELLHVEEGTVKSRLSRAREKLRAILKKKELF